MTMRIGAIQSTLARVSGTPAPAKAEASASGAAGAAALAGAVPGLGAPSAALPATPAAFTQALQEALAPPATTKPLPAAPAPAPPAAPGSSAGIAKSKQVGNEPPATSDGVDGSEVVRNAKKYLGIPYVWGGNNPEIGLDCSSFVQHTFRDLGVELPRVARQQAREGTEVPSLAQAKPGDLIVTRGGSHIGIYLGDNKMIHAPRPGESVSIRKLFETDATIMTIRRIVPSDSAGASEAKAAASAKAAAVTQQAELTAAAQRALFSTAVSSA